MVGRQRPDLPIRKHIYTQAKCRYLDRQEPAFLRRLRGEAAGLSDTDRHERPIARPRRAKADDQDDAPTYVLGDSNDTLSREEYEALVSGKPADEAEEKGKDAEDPGNASLETRPQTEAQEPTRDKQRVQEIGKTSKKRKAVKVGGDDAEDEDDKPPKSSQPKKVKKKAKPVKLSFGDD